MNIINVTVRFALDKNRWRFAGKVDEKLRDGRANNGDWEHAFHPSEITSHL